MSIPDNCSYTKTHEWVRIDGDLAVAGITDHAQESLGDITYVELPSSGQRVEQGGELGVIESVKAASDLYAPLSGEVAEANAALADQPELVNESPYERGWLVKLRDVSGDELASLMDAEAYGAFLESEA